MSTIWNSALRWLPRRNRDERALELIVATVGANLPRRHVANPDALRAEAEKVASIGDEREAIAASLALFAAAAQHTIGLTPFDVQFRAAAAMALGFAIEMQTGEGKTLAVAAAATVLALRNRRVHVATVNQYLAERDHGLFAPVLQVLGLNAGLLTDRDSPDQKRRNYACPIVYGTGYAFGFDYLREQLRLLQRRSMKPGEKLGRRLSGVEDERPLQPQLDCVIVDELDAVLLDEAGVPLILSTQRPASSEAPEVFHRASLLAQALKDGGHCSLDTANRRSTVSEDGFRLIGSISRETSRRNCVGLGSSTSKTRLRSCLFFAAMSTMSLPTTESGSSTARPVVSSTIVAGRKDCSAPWSFKSPSRSRRRRPAQLASLGNASSNSIHISQELRALSSRPERN